MSKPTKVDILVSGAGPVGLFFTYQMALRGHSVYCVDPKPGPTDQSRAILITTRTMEILEQNGLAAEILSESFVSSGIRMHRSGAVIAQVDALGDTPFPHMTILMQGKTEEIMNNRLEEETETKVHWETELVSYTQDDRCVTSVIRNNNTKEETVIESTYIVGADGSHSRVRKTNPDWTYNGAAIQTKFALADLTIQGEYVKNMLDKMNVFMKGTSSLGMIRVNPIRATGGDDSHIFRIFGNLETYSRDDTKSEVTHGLQKTKEAPPTIEFVQKWVDEIAAPIKLKTSDLIWSSFFRINERIANGFRKNRAFLIGDSAHCHSPVGGQGMNLGLHDANNLAWKMSEVLKGVAANPEQLLDSYSFEREPEAKATISATSSVTKAGFYGNKWISDIRVALTSTALMIPQIRQMAFKTIMQTFVTVDSKSPILGKSDKGLIQVGQFLPDSGTLRKSIVPVVKSKSRPRTIHRQTLREILIDNQKYTIILVGTCFAGTLPSIHLIEKFWKDTRRYPVKRIVIESAWHNHLPGKFPSYVTKDEELIAQESFYSEERMDSPISVTSRVGLYSWLASYFSSGAPPCVMLLVRPDLYVSHAKLVTNEAELDEVLEYVSTIFSA